MYRVHDRRIPRVANFYPWRGVRDHYPKIAVIGAGIAGLTCARFLRERGLDNLIVFDKARGPGGRMSTRRHGDCFFDHGAQFFTIRDENFAEFLRPLRMSGTVRPWKARFYEHTEHGMHPRTTTEERWIGAPRMSSILRTLQRRLETKFETRVAPISHDGSRFVLVDEGDTPLGSFDFVVVTAPAPQSADLVKLVDPSLARRIEREVVMSPCWTAMLRFDAEVDVSFDALSFRGHPVLGWLARNRSKHGRGQHETWVAHATTAWSKTNLEMSKPEAADVLAHHCIEHLGATPPTLALGHRWRYAMVERSLGAPTIKSIRAPGLILAGDWCTHARLEGASISGRSAGQIVASLVDSSP